MSAVDALVTVGPVLLVLEVFPVWGPVLAVVLVVLLVEAFRATWGTAVEDTGGDSVPRGVPAGVPGPGDTGGPRRVTCGDSDPRVSHWPGPGGGR